MYESVLVPLDGSGAAEIVFPYAEEIAAKFNSEIILLSVSAPTTDDKNRLYRSYLDGIAENVQGRLDARMGKEKVRVKTEVVFGKSASEILRYADEGNVSLIAMASRGLSGHGPWLLGHVAGKVLRAAEIPVLLVRPSADKAVPQQGALVKKILLPLDGSRVGEAAIPCVESLALTLNAEIVLLQIIKLSALVASEGAAMSSAMIREEEEFKRASAVAYLKDIEKNLIAKGLKTAIAVGSGSPADQIIDFAETNSIDLIAMSTHGRSGIGRWVFGSVTDKVLHSGDTSVLTVRAKKD